MTTPHTVQTVPGQRASAALPQQRGPHCANDQDLNTDGKNTACLLNAYGLPADLQEQDAAPRWLSQLLTAASAWTPDRHRLQNELRVGDRLLYDAFRDVLPPRRGLNDGSVGGWYADLVRYQPGVLANQEPIRSTGHWNTPGQLEIFQTITGRTLMLTATATPRGDHHIGAQTCQPGDIATVPFGAWHLTYVLDGPATVFNIYADHPGAGGHSSRYAAAAPHVKYSADQPPPQIAARAKDGKIHLVDAVGEIHIPHAVEPADWLQPIIKADSLAGIFRYAGDTQLAELMTRAWDNR